MKKNILCQVKRTYFLYSLHSCCCIHYFPHISFENINSDIKIASPMFVGFNEQVRYGGVCLGNSRWYISAAHQLGALMLLSFAVIRARVHVSRLAWAVHAGFPKKIIEQQENPFLCTKKTKKRQQFCFKHITHVSQLLLTCKHSSSCALRHVQVWKNTQKTHTLGSICGEVLPLSWRVMWINSVATRVQIDI